MRYTQGGGLTTERRDFREQILYQAGERFTRGEKTAVIAKDLRVSEGSVERWRRAWRTGRNRRSGARRPTPPATRCITGWPTSARTPCTSSPPPWRPSTARSRSKTSTSPGCSTTGVSREESPTPSSGRSAASSPTGPASATPPAPSRRTAGAPPRRPVPGAPCDACALVIDRDAALNLAAFAATATTGPGVAGDQDAQAASKPRGADHKTRTTRPRRKAEAGRAGGGEAENPMDSDEESGRCGCRALAIRQIPQPGKPCGLSATLSRTAASSPPLPGYAVMGISLPIMFRPG